MSRVTEKLSRREEDRVTRRAIMQKLLKSPALRKILVDHLRARDAASKDAPPVTATRSHSGRSGSVLSRSKTTRKCGTMPQNDANSHRYAGDSLVIDHAGETLADAGGDGASKAVCATLQRADMMAFRRKLPFLSDADRFGVR